MELTDGGQFECRSEDGEHIHDIILKVNCELNNDQCEIVTNIASAIAKLNIPSNTATTTTNRTSIDGDGHNSSNTIKINNNNLRNSNTVTTNNISALHAVPTAAETLSARSSSSNNYNNNISNVINDINSDASVFSNAESVVNRIMVARQIDGKSKRFRSNYYPRGYYLFQMKYLNSV